MHSPQSWKLWCFSYRRLHASHCEVREPKSGDIKTALADDGRIQEDAPKRLRNVAEHDVVRSFHDLQAAVVTVVVPLLSKLKQRCKMLLTSSNERKDMTHM